MATRKRDSKGRFIPAKKQKSTRSTKAKGTTKKKEPAKKEQPGKSTRFSSENQPEKNGRKKKVTTVLKDYGHSSSEIRDWFRVISQMPLAEVRKLAKDEQQPVIVTTIAETFIKAKKYGSYQRVKEIAEQVIGRPSMKAEVDLSGLNVEIINLGESEFKKNKDTE